MRNCFKYGPGPCGCRGDRPIPCLATIGPYVGQVVCAPQCALPKQVSQDCSCCIDTCNTHPAPPADLCGSHKVQCLASCGPNAGKMVCAPKCPPSQQQSPDCTQCVVVVNAPSPAPDSKPSPSSKGKSTTPAKDKSKGGKRRSLRQAEIDMMMM